MDQQNIGWSNEKRYRMTSEYFWCIFLLLKVEVQMQIMKRREHMQTVWVIMGRNMMHLTPENISAYHYLRSAKECYNEWEDKALCNLTGSVEDQSAWEQMQTLVLTVWYISNISGPMAYGILLATISKYIACLWLQDHSCLMVSEYSSGPLVSAACPYIYAW